MMLVDSHCHFHLIEQDNPSNTPSNVIQRAQQQNVSYFLNVSVDMSTFPNVLAVANQFDNVYASVGLHPNHNDEEVTFEQLMMLATENKVIAIGETGLDFYRSSPQNEQQKEYFVMHMEVAKSIQKPLIIHTRQAQSDTIVMMREHQACDAGGVMHCFTEDWEMAKQALDMGFYISISGIVTFKNAHTVQDVAKRVPLNRLLIETDAPYLAPEPMRGKPNEPAYVRHTADYIAQLRGVTVETIAEHTTNNFFTLFKGALNTHV